MTGTDPATGTEAPFVRTTLADGSTRVRPASRGDVEKAGRAGEAQQQLKQQQQLQAMASGLAQKAGTDTISVQTPSGTREFVLTGTDPATSTHAPFVRTTDASGNVTVTPATKADLRAAARIHADQASAAAAAATPAVITPAASTPAASTPTAPTPATTTPAAPPQTSVPQAGPTKRVEAPETARQMRAFAPADVPHLTGTQLHFLPERAARVMSEAQIAALDPDTQMPHLTEKQIGQWSRRQLGALSDAQFQKIDAKVFGELGKRFINKLTSAQTSLITPDQASAMSKQQVKALSDAQVEAMTPEQFAAFDDAQWNALGKKQAKALTSDQLSQVDPSIYPRLPHHVMQTIDAAQFGAQPETQIGDYHRKALNAMTYQQTRSFDTKAKVQAVAVDQLARMDGNSFRKWSPVQFMHFSDAQRAALGTDQLRAWRIEHKVALESNVQLKDRFDATMADAKKRDWQGFKKGAAIQIPAMGAVGALAAVKPEYALALGGAAAAGRGVLHLVWTGGLKHMSNESTLGGKLNLIDGILRPMGLGIGYSGGNPFNIGVNSIGAGIKGPIELQRSQVNQSANRPWNQIADAAGATGGITVMLTSSGNPYLWAGGAAFLAASAEPTVRFLAVNRFRKNNPFPKDPASLQKAEKFDQKWTLSERVGLAVSGAALVMFGLFSAADAAQEITGWDAPGSDMLNTSQNPGQQGPNAQPPAIQQPAPPSPPIVIDNPATPFANEKLDAQNVPFIVAQPGDSVGGIARANGRDVADTVTLNLEHIPDPVQLQPGYRVYLP